MIYLLDTNACIRYLNGQSETLKFKFQNISPHDIALCSVVKAELLFGAAKSGRPEENLHKLQLFFDHFISLPFDDQAAEEYAIIRSSLEKAGKPIGPNDLMIAAIAIANDVTLITHNTKEFSRVKRLVFEDWEER